MPNNRTRVKINDIVASQLPEFIREQYPTFVAFVEAYYEFLDQNQVDINKIRDIDETLDEFVKYFKAELAHNYPVSASYDTERYLLKHIKDQYLAKGSEASYKLLFRLLYGKDVYMDYPGRSMLRVSDGRWQQDISLFVRVEVGSAPDLIGKIVDIQTSKKIYISTPVEGYSTTGVTVTKVTANIENVLPIDAANGIYEIFLNRNFYGDILPGDIVKYKSTFQGQILPVTSKIKIQNKGVGFKPGMVFQVSSGDGTPLWFKVLETKDYLDKDGNKVIGGLKTIDLIRFGLGYTTDFSITILPTSAVSTKKKTSQSAVAISYSIIQNTVAGANIISGGTGYTIPPILEVGGVGGSGATAHAVITDGVITEVVIDSVGEGYESAYINVITAPGDTTGTGGQIEPFIGSIYNYAFNDKTNGFNENGYLSYGDYWASAYSDGAYVGTIARQFFVDAKDTISNDAALLNVSLGAQAKYPGYYKTNDGFLDDSMFIQDSYYYQAFSYVIRIDKQLDSYASVVRTMLHPSGMAMFGEYSINNSVALSVALTSLVKSLGITLFDVVSVNDDYEVDQNGNVIRGSYFKTYKDLNTSINAPLDAIQKIIFYKSLQEEFIAVTEPLFNWNFNKRVGFTGQTETVFTQDDGSKKAFTKSVTDTSSLVENFTNKTISKSRTDFQAVTDQTALTFTLNTIIDPLPGIYPEEGYVVLNPYDQGGYFEEHYANTRDAFSS